MASIPPNVENTEISDFLKLGQDCEQIAITAYQTCPDMQLMYPGAHACCSKQPAIQRPKAGSANENGHVQPNAENI